MALVVSEKQSVNKAWGRGQNSGAVPRAGRECWASRGGQRGTEAGEGMAGGQAGHGGTGALAQASLTPRRRHLAWQSDCPFKGRPRTGAHTWSSGMRGRGTKCCFWEVNMLPQVQPGTVSLWCPPSCFLFNLWTPYSPLTASYYVWR